ncbi:MAG TPA: hypothetical protein VIZ68_03020 [Thermoplasmata archaeon]
MEPSITEQIVGRLVGGEFALLRLWRGPAGHGRRSGSFVISRRK